jgi:hypothetical protein
LGPIAKYRALREKYNFTGSLPIPCGHAKKWLLTQKTKKMKNFETILNTGQDAANYIEIDDPTNIFVVGHESL